MPDTVTPILGLVKPEIGASPNTWGNKLNGNFDVLDKTPVNTAQWKITMGDGSPTSSAGPWTLSRYDNTPTLVDNPISVNRQTGDVTITDNLVPLKQVQLADGTSGTPSLGFLLETTLGFFRKAASKIGFTGRLDGNGAVPAGAIMDFAMAAAPTGWLACDGQSLAVASYPDLFNAIGYTYGGSGANFNVPQAITRYRRHRDNASVSGAVGTTQAACNAAHTHNISLNTSNESNDHTHSFSGNTGVDSPDHTHTTTGLPFVAGNNNNNGGGGGAFAAISSTQGSYTSGGASARHAHPFSGTTSGISALHSHSLNGATLGGSADGPETRPISLTVLTCIKT